MTSPQAERGWPLIKPPELAVRVQQLLANDRLHLKFSKNRIGSDDALDAGRAQPEPQPSKTLAFHLLLAAKAHQPYRFLRPDRPQTRGYGRAEEQTLGAGVRECHGSLPKAKALAYGVDPDGQAFQ